MFVARSSYDHVNLIHERLIGDKKWNFTEISNSDAKENMAKKEI